MKYVVKIEMLMWERMDFAVTADNVEEATKEAVKFAEANSWNDEFEIINVIER